MGILRGNVLAGLDRDADGYYDRDEFDLGSDPIQSQPTLRHSAVSRYHTFSGRTSADFTVGAPCTETKYGGEPV